MKTINCLRDLSHYGIDPLTGEACGLGMRILCDLTVPGRDTVCKALGIKPEGLEDAWNSRAVASIMLGHDCFREIATFALLDQGGCHIVVAKRAATMQYGEAILRECEGVNQAG